MFGGVLRYIKCCSSRWRDVGLQNAPTLFDKKKYSFFRFKLSRGGVKVARVTCDFKYRVQSAGEEEICIA
ncbi:Protein of unknown function [Gryllus bimaculatus]|nr:Protein of unknown function [Gryllus bimaculatus]